MRVQGVYLLLLALIASVMAAPTGGTQPPQPPQTGTSSSSSSPNPPTIPVEPPVSPSPSPSPSVIPSSVSPSPSTTSPSVTSSSTTTTTTACNVASGCNPGVPSTITTTTTTTMATTATSSSPRPTQTARPCNDPYCTKDANVIPIGELIYGGAPAPELLPTLAISAIPTSISYCDGFKAYPQWSFPSSGAYSNITATLTWSQHPLSPLGLSPTGKVATTQASGPARELSQRILTVPPGGIVANTSISGNLIITLQLSMTFPGNTEPSWIAINTQIQVLSTAAPTISFIGGTASSTGGLPLFTGYVGQPLTIGTTVTWPSCGAVEALTYTWTVSGGQTTFPSGAVTNAAQLYVPGGMPYSGPAGFVLTVTITTASNKTASAQANGQSLYLPIVARILGQATGFDIGPQIPITLDGSLSYDTGFPRAKLNYAWTCGKWSPTTMSYVAEATCPDFVSTTTTSRLTIPANRLTAGITYSFGLTVTNPATNQSASTGVDVRVATNIQFCCYMGLDTTNKDGSNVVSVTNAVGLYVQCTNLNYARAQFTWSAKTGGASVPDLANASNLLIGSQTSRAIYLKPKVLVGGTTTTFTCTIVDGASGTNQTVTADIVVRAPPSGGAVSVTPGTGNAYTDAFSFVGSSFLTEYGPLTYQFSVIDNSNGKEYILGVASTSNVNSPVYIPAVGSLTPRCVVQDQYGATADANGTAITTNPITTGDVTQATQVVNLFVTQQLAAAINSGDPAQVMAAAQSAASILLATTSSLQGGYTPDTAKAVADAQAPVMNAITKITNDPTVALTPAQATFAVQTIMSMDISIMPPTVQAAALTGLVRSFATLAIGGAGKPISPSVVQSFVNTLSSLFAGNLKKRKSSSNKRRSLDVESTVELVKRQSANTYPTNPSAAVNEDPAVLETAIEATIQLCAGMTNDLVCGAPAKNNPQEGVTLTAQIVNLDGTQKMTVGTTNDYVIYQPSYIADPNAISETANCYPAGGVLSYDHHNATIENGFCSPVLSASYPYSVAQALAANSSFMLEFDIRETSACLNGTFPSCHVWNPTANKYDNSSCITSNYTLNADSTYSVHCKCKYFVASATPTDPAVPVRADFAIGRIAAAVTPSPSSSPTGTPDEGGNKLGGGAIAGIVIGCVAGVALVAGGAFYVIRKR